MSKEESFKEIEKLNKVIEDFRNKVESQDRKTITDLEAYIVAGNPKDVGDVERLEREFAD